MQHPEDNSWIGLTEYEVINPSGNCWCLLRSTIPGKWCSTATSRLALSKK